nr:EOG090X0FHR [Lepidurus arcticus]
MSVQLEHFVNNVQTLSGQGNWRELCDYFSGNTGSHVTPRGFVPTLPRIIIWACALENMYIFVIVDMAVTSQGWYLDHSGEKPQEKCLYNDDHNACNYAVGIGVIAFLAATGLLVAEVLFQQMSSIKTRKHFVLGDLGFSGFWAFLYFVGFCYLSSQWSYTSSETAEVKASANNLRAAIAFSFFSIFTWAGSAYFAFQRYRQGADAAFGSSFEAGADGTPNVGGITTPGTSGYTSFPGAADPVTGMGGSYQQPPFGSNMRAEIITVLLYNIDCIEERGSPTISSKPSA